MVFSRCKLVVKSKLEKLGLHPIAIELGEVELTEDITENQKEVLIKELKILGFEWLGEKTVGQLKRLKH